MATRFKKEVGWKRKTFFHLYAYAINSTQVGVWTAAAITTSVASDLDTVDIVKKGATVIACYLVPGAPAYTIVKNVDRAVHTGKKVSFYGSLAYKASKFWSVPIEYVNSLGAKALTEMGVTEAVKNACGVEKCDAFWWKRSEYVDLN